MTDPKTLTAEQAAWQLINPTGHVVATETSCVKAWARIGGYKPTVEALLGCEEAGWRVERATREQTTSTGEPFARVKVENKPGFGSGSLVVWMWLWGNVNRLPEGEHDLYAAPVEQAGSAPDETLREALAELVACKDLKHRFQNIRFIKMTAESETLAREYDRRQPLAWEAARRALATPTKPDA